jgi:hypothetical protein
MPVTGRKEDSLTLSYHRACSFEIKRDNVCAEEDALFKGCVSGGSQRVVT